MIGTPETGKSSDTSRPIPPIDPSALLGEAWGLFAGSWPTCLVVYWGAFAAFWVIMNLLVVVLAGLNAMIGDPSFTPVLEFVRFVGLFLVPAWLWLGQGIGFLRIARREPVAVEDLFRGGPYLLTALLSVAAFLAIVAVPCLTIYGAAEAFLSLGGDPPLATMWRKLAAARSAEDFEAADDFLLVLLGASVAILALWVAILLAVRSRLRPFPFLILDRNAGVPGALGTSIRLTGGRMSTLLVVHLAQFTINLAGLMLCCLGLLVSLPFTRLVSAVTYNALAADLPPIEVPENDDDDRD